MHNAADIKACAWPSHFLLTAYSIPSKYESNHSSVKAQRCADVQVKVHLTSKELHHHPAARTCWTKTVY